MLIAQDGGQPLINTPHIPSKSLGQHVVPTNPNGSTTPTVMLGPRRLAAFDPKVRNAILQLHLRREYISLDAILDEIARWTAIEQLFYVEFLFQQQSHYIDEAVVCQPQYRTDDGIRTLRVDFLLSLPDPVMSALPPILFYVELDSFRWHDRTPEEFAKDRRRMRVLQRKGGRAYPFAGAEVWRNAKECVVEVVNAMEDDLLERRRMARLATVAALRPVRR
jgi:hypothetical protein